MSFVLQLLHAPGVRTLADAVAAADAAAGRPASAEDRLRFERFRQRVTRSYPDLSDIDEDGDDPRNVWAEGLGGAVGTAVWVLAPKTSAVDEVLMGHVALAAAAADLLVLDAQNAHLYRPDRKRVDAQGRITELATPPRPALRTAPVPPPPAAPAPNWGPEQRLRDRLHRLLLHRLADHGFVASPKRWEDDALEGVQRVHRGSRQKIRISVGVYPDEILCGVQFELHLPPVAAVWQQLLGDVVQPYLAHCAHHGLPTTDLQASTDELVVTDSHLAAPYGFDRRAQLPKAEACEAWLQGFGDWLQAEGLAALDAAATPAGAARCALAPRQHQRLVQTIFPLPCELFSRTTLIAAFGDLRQGGWDEALHGPVRRRMDGQDVAQWFDLHGTLDTLMARLESPAAAPLLQGLRAA